jgi:ABC-2 type transport system ATP-binding protein
MATRVPPVPRDGLRQMTVRRSHPRPHGPTRDTAAIAARGPATDGRTAPGHAPLVLMEQVSRRFGDFLAIDRISLAVPGGTILGLIGPSGSGKTTTIRTLTGALAPSSGRALVLGEDPRRFRRSTRERIGYMPQDFVLYPDLTAGENLGFVAALFGLLWRRRRARVRAVLELVDLWEVRDRRASRLSGGMQRRLELASALVHEPTLMFLDEPTAGIDPLLRQRVWHELRRLRDEGRTLLVTTQQVGEAEYCDAVALISSGQLIALAPPNELRRVALGGDVLQVETSQPFDVRQLRPIGGVFHVRQYGPRGLLVYAGDAGSATPGVLGAIEAAGGEVASSREYRPSFDEVFALLVERHRAQRAAWEAGRDGSVAAAPDGTAAPTPRSWGP